MKKYFQFLILFICFAFTLKHVAAAQAQSTRIASPMGGIISLSPGITITQTSPSTTFFSDVITANSFIPTRWYHLKMAFKLSTPTIGIPGISATFQYGSQTFNLMSNASLIGGITNGLFVIDFTMISTGAATQIPFAEIRQPNGTLITLSTATATPVGAFTVDSTVDQNFTVSLVFTGGVSLGTSSLTNFWSFRDAF